MTDFQAQAGRQGRRFADQCNDALKSVGFELQGSLRLPEIGVEIDQVATTQSGRRLWFEYKGSVRGKTPGLMRTDTTKKAIANAALTRTLSNARPFVVVTSHLPEKGYALAMLKTALTAGYFEAVICIYNPGWENQLRAL